MKLIYLLLGILSIPFYASSQIINFNKNGHQLVRFDALGDAVDAHDGEIAQFNGVYYLYGTSYDCGYEWGNKEAPFCGFKVYASKDLKNWEDKGFLFDAKTPVWQTRCNGKTYGCYRPHVVYNEKTGLYVLWINVYDNRTGYRVFTSKSPIGPFKEVAEPTVAVNANMPVAGLNNGDHDTFIDDDGTAYLAYTDWRAKGAIVIEQLSDDYLTGTGKHVLSVTGGQTEAPCLFKRNGIYYVVYSDPNCGYCSGTGSSYKTAPSPLGPWSEPIKISDNSCGGQPSFVSVIKVNSKAIYLYGSDLWNNAAKNEALANYYWAQLEFTETGAIKPLSCTEDYTSNGFSVKNDITNTRQYAQSFTVKQSGQLSRLTVTLFRNKYPDADLIVELYKTTPDGTPAFQVKLNPQQLGWSPKNTAIIMPNLRVKKGDKYTLVLRTTTSGTGNYGCLFGRASTGLDGKAAVRTSDQDAFTELPDGSIRFQTFVK